MEGCACCVCVDSFAVLISRCALSARASSFRSLCVGLYILSLEKRCAALLLLRCVYSPFNRPLLLFVALLFVVFALRTQAHALGALLPREVYFVNADNT